MNKILLLLLFGFSIVTFSVKAQQVPFYNHYLINPFVYNPAFSGASDYVNASFARNQRFSSFGSTAVNNYLTVEGAIAKGKMGLGLIVGHQSQGVQQQLMSSLSYAYKLKINEDHAIRFGVSGGFIDNRIDYSELNAQEYNDPYLIGLRPTKPVFDMNVGLMYNWKDLKVGFSVPQVIGGKVNYASDKGRGYYQMARHYMLSLEYDFKVGEHFILKPHALVRYVPTAPIQYDGSLMATYRNLVWASATYKSDYAIQFNAGVRILDFLRVGYSYELLIGKMRTYSTGMNHEIFLGFSFKARKEKEIQLVEKEVVKEVIKEVPVMDETAQRQRDSIQVLKDELERKLKLMQEELANKDREKTDVVTPTTKPVETVKPKEDVVIPLAAGYRFVNLDKTDSPDGFYVITGVFSNKNNADNLLKSMQVEHANAHLVINQSNTYYYVVILHTLDQELATSTFTNYKAKTNQKAWILNYIKN